jgi:aminoglycoside phosphotransferase (APT) family kinase protein
VKAASSQVNPDTPRLHRQEARILDDLDPLIRSGRLPAPRVRATVEHGSWFALLLDDIDGRHPALPWEDGQVSQVLGALDSIADVLTPAPVSAPAIGDYLGTDFTGWRILAQSPGDERLDPWSRARLTELATLEATWAGHAGGATLLHADIRADNLLLTGDGVIVVDWPHACRGAAFVDVVLWAPSVADARRPTASRPAHPVTRRTVSQPRQRDGVRVRHGWLLHRTVPQAAPARDTNGPRIPGRAGRGYPPLAGATPVTRCGHDRSRPDAMAEQAGPSRSRPNLPARRPRFVAGSSPWVISALVCLIVSEQIGR